LPLSEALAVQGVFVKSSILFILLIFSDLAVADKWGPPDLTSAISEDSSIVVRIIPGKGFLNTDIKSPDKTFAQANYFKWNGSDGYDIYQNIRLQNPAAPIYSFITDDGKLVTIDNWYSKGSGKVVVIYSPIGEVIKAYELDDLFPLKADFDKLGRSVSSINWQCYELQPDLRHGFLYVPHALGGSLRFDLSTGELNKIQPDRHCK